MKYLMEFIDFVHVQILYKANSKELRKTEVGGPEVIRFVGKEPPCVVVGVEIGRAHV